MATNSETDVRPYERLQVHTAKETFVSIDNGGVSYSVVKVDNLQLVGSWFVKFR